MIMATDKEIELLINRGKYENDKKEVIIGKREGRFNGMLEKRTFEIKWIKQDQADSGLDFNSKPDYVVTYNGDSVSLKMK